MRRDNKHNLLIWLLALMVVFAPMQAALSAIDMLDHQTGQKQHCQMDIAGKVDHANMDHSDMDHSDMGQGDCCQHEGACHDNCSTCNQCISAHAMLFDQTLLHHQSPHQFVDLKSSLAKGISRHSEHRPPRSLS